MPSCNVVLLAADETTDHNRIAVQTESKIRYDFIFKENDWYIPLGITAERRCCGIACRSGAMLPFGYLAKCQVLA